MSVSVCRVVVGAAGQVGSALAAHLRSVSGRLIAVDRVSSDGPVPVISCDVTDPAFADLLVLQLAGCTRAELYHTAGWVPLLARVDDTPTGTFATAVTRNLTSAYAALRAFALAAGRLDLHAAAVAVTSVGAHRYHVGYDAAKAGVESVVRTLALEYGSRLSVRAFALGPLAESTSTAADGEASPALVQLVPLGRYARLAEVAEAIALFGGPAFDPANRHILIFDGGLLVQLRPVEVERAPPEESRGAQ
ncbi:MAG: SDR family oxidoreductase [Pseudonocardiaceae bacterium]